MYQRMISLLQDMLLQLAAHIHEGEDALMDLWRSFVAACLNLVPSDQPYKTALFDALNLKQPTFAMEGVLLRENPESKELEVYLTRRSLADTAYPGEFHAPGSGLRNKEDWEKVAARLARNEYKVPVKKVTILHESARFYDEARGTYCSVPCLIELDGEPEVGKWFSISKLPEKTVWHHREWIIPAVVSYWRNRAKYDAARDQMRAALGL